MRYIAEFFVVSFFCSVWATSVFADVSLAAFEGLWEGAAVSESSTSVNFAITSRDIDVEIRPQADKSFTLKWKTLLRQKGQADAPVEVIKETTRTYMPTSDHTVWHGTNGDDLYKGETISWAKLKGQELTVYSLAMRKSGGYDMLIYSRTLTGLGMKLEFKAMRNGELRRTASGTLIRSGK